MIFFIIKVEFIIMFMTSSMIRYCHVLVTIRSSWLITRFYWLVGVRRKERNIGLWKIVGVVSGEKMVLWEFDEVLMKLLLKVLLKKVNLFQKCIDDVTCWWRHLLMTSLTDDVTCWWHHLLMTSLVGDVTCWWRHLLMTLLADDVTCWWRHLLMTSLVGDVTCWWCHMLMTSHVDDVTCWWRHLLMMSHVGDVTCWWRHMLMTSLWCFYYKFKLLWNE